MSNSRAEQADILERLERLGILERLKRSGILERSNFSEILVALELLEVLARLFTGYSDRIEYGRTIVHGVIDTIDTCTKSRDIILSWCAAKYPEVFNISMSVEPMKTMRMLEWLAKNNRELLPKINENGRTLAHQAVEFGCDEVLLWLADNCPEIFNTSISSTSTTKPFLYLFSAFNLIRIAFAQKKQIILGFLVSQYREQLMQTDYQGRTIAHYAAEWGQVGILKGLLHSDLSALLRVVDIRGRTIAHVAAEYGQLDVLNWLWSFSCLEWSLPLLDAVDNTGSPLAFLAAKHGHLGILKQLDLSEGRGGGRLLYRQLSRANFNRYTLAYVAAESGQLDILKWLIQRDEPLSIALNPYEDIALIAIQSEKLTVLKWLITACETEFNLNATRIDISVSLACLHEMIWDSDIRENAIISEWIARKYSTQLKQADTVDCYLAHKAAKEGRVDILKWLANQSCLSGLLAQSNHLGYTIAHIAILSRSPTILKWLAQENSALWDSLKKKHDRRGRTLADFAEEQGLLDLFEELDQGISVLTASIFCQRVIRGQVPAKTGMLLGMSTLQK